MKSKLITIAMALLLMVGGLGCVTGKIAPLGSSIETVAKAEYKVIGIEGNNGEMYTIVVPATTPNFFEKPYVPGAAMPLGDIAYMVNFMDGEKRYTILVMQYPDGTERIAAFFDAQTKTFYGFSKDGAIPVVLTEEEAKVFLEKEDKRIREMKVS